MRATNLANEFSNHGYTVDIIATKEIAEKQFSALNENVNIVSLSEYNNSLSNCYYANKAISSVKRRIALYKKIRLLTKCFPKIDKYLELRIRFLRRGIELRKYFINNKNSIVIPFGISYLEPTVSAVHKLNCKVFYAEKNAPELEFPERNSEEYKYVIKLLNGIDGVIVQTQNAKEFFGGSLKNIHVINNPIKVGLPKPYVGDRKKTIVNFCRMNPQKNLDLLIDSFVKFQKEYPEYNLEIYGNIVDEAEAKYRDKILDKVKRLNMADYISILPPSSEVHKKILNCAMFVSSSDYEGLSNSMIEAMAIGLPCICTDCLGGGTREVMVDMENGLIVNMNDTDAMYNAMKLFAIDGQLAAECGANASKLKDKLSVEQIANRWLSVLN